MDIWYTVVMAEKKLKFNIVNLVNNDGCFDLQFRKDTRHERTGSPTYYRWKIQFVITTPKENIKVLAKVKKEIGCGSVSVAGNQARFSIQDIDCAIKTIIPYFTKNKLSNNPPSHKASAGQSKQKDFDLWQKAVAIIYQNKGVYLSKWKKNDLIHLMEIHKAMAKYKAKPRKQKWIEMAKTLAKK